MNFKSILALGPRGRVGGRGREGRRAAARVARAALVESLEDRRLMSATLTADGTLTETGTAANDTIAVKNVGGLIVVVENRAVVGSFAAAKVKGLAIFGGAGNDSITVGNGVGNALLDGGDGNDTLIGGDGNDLLQGGNGDDLLDGGRGNDVIIGGAGNDTVDYSGRTGGVFINLSNGAYNIPNRSFLDPTGRFSGELGEFDSFPAADVENAKGGTGNDTLIGTDGDNQLAGNGGNDQIFGMGGNDSLAGGDGNDWLVGGDGNDTLSGGSGNDTLAGNAGADNLSGGSGTDVVDYSDRSAAVFINLTGASGAAVNGEAGEHDVLANDFEIANGGSGNDTILGNVTGETLNGNGGNDTLKAGAGNEVLNGGAGNDALYSGTAPDTLNGGDGDDVLVSIGNSKNVVNGNGGQNVFWVNPGDVIDKPAVVNGVAQYSVHVVDRFFDGVSKVRGGQNLRDPGVIAVKFQGGSGEMPAYHNYSGTPLFQGNRPFETDVRQGSVGDCFFLATLAGLAGNNPNRIADDVVDLGDGTYAVAFRKSGAYQYVRVDADLPTLSDGRLAFAGISDPQGNGRCLWAAIMEKAYAEVRQGNETYAALDTGGWPREAFAAMGTSADTLDLPDQHGIFGIFGHYAVHETLQDLLSKGLTVVVSTPDTLPPGSPLVSTHAYAVDGVAPDGSVSLYNPWGQRIIISAATAEQLVVADSAKR